MKGLKQWAGLLTAGIWVCAAMPGARGDEATVGGVAWRYIVSGEGAVVTGAEPAEGVLSIPGSLGGHPVTGIGYAAFASLDGLTSVAIPPGVTNIADRAFQYCSLLEAVSIPEGVADIGAMAFQYCESLSSLVLPQSVETLGANAFCRCDALAKLFVPLAWFGTEWASAADLGAECTVVYGEPGKETVVFDPNGGSCDTVSHTYPLENVHGWLPEATRPHHAFAGWWTDAEGGTAVTADAPAIVEGRRVLYAHWTPTEQEVVFDACGGTCGTTNRVYAFGAKYTPLPQPVRNGYSFDGWFTAVTGGDRISAASTVTESALRTLYAHWTLTEQVVTFDANGGSCNTESRTYAVGGTYGWLPPAEPSAYFDGWRTEDGTLVETTSVVPPVRNQTLEARWWEFSPATMVGITGVNPAVGSLEIPSTLDGCSVTSIRYDAFRHCSGITSVTIPESVRVIGWGAFANCTGLKSVTILGDAVYDGWDESPPFGGSGLETVVLGDKVTQISPWMFECSHLKSVTISDSVTSIGDWAFCGCSGLTNLTIPNSVTHIGPRAFWGTSSLYDTNTIPGVCIVDGWVVETTNGLPSSLDLTGIRGIADGTFSWCTGITDVFIPDGVASIGDGAFEGCLGLTNIIIPDSVASIGSWAFSGCIGLTKITIPDSVTSIGYGAFGGCSNLADITIPDSVANIGGEAFGGCASSLYDTNAIPGVCLVDGWVVGTTDGLPANLDLTGIRGIASTFRRCTGLVRVILPEGMTSIPDWMFFGCSNLVDITIPSSVTSIGDGAFGGCSNLVDITIPDSVTSIGRDAFRGCPSSLFDTNAIPGVCLVDGWVVGTTDGLPANLDLAGIRGIAPEAFKECDGLASVAIPEGVKGIGTWAFWGCDSLTSVTIPQSVMSLGTDPFPSCKGLQTLYVPDSLKFLHPCQLLGPSIDANTGTRIIYYGDTVATPVISPAGGNASAHEPCKVTISCATEGAEIYYSTNGVTPRPTAAYRYTGPFEIDGSAFVKAVAVLVGVKSEYVSAVFTDVEAALAGGADPRLAENITTAEAYGEFRAWFEEKGLDAQSVKDSEHAWPSYLLGAGKLFLNEPTMELALVSPIAGAEGSKTSGGGVFDVRVTVKDGARTVAVDAEKVARMFECTGDVGDWAGGEALVANVEPKGTDGDEMLFTVTPEDGTVPKAFLRLCLFQGKAGQTISFAPIGTQAATNRVVLSATASSGGEVAFKVVSGPGKIEGNVLCFTGSGTVVVRAVALGDDQWLPAAETQTVTVEKARQTIAFSNIGEQTWQARVALSATASGGGAVTFEVVSGPGTVKGNTLSFTGPGTVVVRAVQAGDARWLPASATQTVAVEKAAQTITFSAIGERTWQEPAALSATASGGGTVTFEVVSGPGTVQGNALSFTGVGSVVVRAVQAGNARWLPASATQTVTVGKAAQTITFSAIGERTWQEPAALSATASAGGAVTFEVVSGPGQIVENMLSFTGPGAVEVRAVQAGDERWLPVAVTQTVSVAKAAQTLSFAVIGECMWKEQVLLSVTTSSSGAVTFEVVSGPGQIRGNNLLSFTGTGTVEVRAVQAEDELWLPAVATQMISVKPTLAIEGASTVRMGESSTYACVEVYPDGDCVSVSPEWSLADADESMGITPEGVLTTGSVPGQVGHAIKVQAEFEGRRATQSVFVTLNVADRGNTVATWPLQANLTGNTEYPTQLSVGNCTGSGAMMTNMMISNKGLSSPGWAFSGPTDYAYYEFSITPTGNQALNLGVLSLSIRSSYTGPSRAEIRWAVDDAWMSGTTLNNFTNDCREYPYEIDLSDINVFPGQTLRFRLYAWGALQSGGTFRVNASQPPTLTGTFVDVPAHSASNAYMGRFAAGRALNAS